MRWAYLRSGFNAIIHSHLDMTKVSARWVPKLLNDSQKAKRAEVSRKNLRLYQRDPEAFLNRMVTVDETWVHHFTPEKKRTI